MFWRGHQMYRRLGAYLTTNGTSVTGNGASVTTNGTFTTGNGTAVAGNGTSTTNGTAVAGNGASVAGNGAAVADRTPVTEKDLAPLPEPVQRYLWAMRVVGRPRDWSFRAHFHGHFRLAGRSGWMPAEVWQYDTAPQVVRVFHMRVDVAGLIPMVGCDTYVSGHGRTQGKLFDLVPIAHTEGPETDRSELVTYLNDVVLLAPSMLLRLPVSFTAVDDRSFDLRLSDGGQSVSARVHLDGEGLPCDFSSTDRYADLPGGLARAHWTTPVGRWVDASDGAGRRPLATRGQAVWHLDNGPLPYLDFAISPGDVEYNVPACPAPRCATSHRRRTVER